MPLISNKVKYGNTESKLIIEFKKAHALDHKRWGDDNLMPLRKYIRNHYRKEQKLKCAYCMNDVSVNVAANSHVEHIVPKSHNPEFMFHEKNLCVICAECNLIKRNQEVMNSIQNTLRSNKKVSRYPYSSNAFKIVHPHYDEYEDHIVKLGKIYINKTTKGNFTIGACDLNRYFKDFGRNDRHIENGTIAEKMNTFMDSDNELVKFGALNELRELLINP